MQLLSLAERKAAAEVPSLDLGPALEGRFSTFWPQVGRILVLAGADALAVVAAGALAYLVWAHGHLGQDPELYLRLLPLLGLFLVSYGHAGLYPGFGLGAVETLRRLSTRTSFVFLVLAAADFAVKLPNRYSRMTFGLAWVGVLVLVPLGRFLVLGLIKRWAWWAEPVILVGPRAQVEWLLRSLGNALTLGYRPVATVVTDGPGARGRDARARWEALVREFAARGGRVGLVAASALQNGLPAETLRQHLPRLVVLQDAEALPVEGTEVRNLGGLLGVELRNNLLRWQNRVLKRAMDLAVAVPALLVALPVIALGALAVRLASPGPAFFGQRRIGEGGRPITVWKIRTMYPDAEQRLADYLRADAARAREWAERCKLSHDPRVIPRIGTFLRRFSLDELPQLWAVVKGELSLVGPRPFPEYHLERFSEEFRILRHRVKPGVTGLWQVLARTEGALYDQELLDRYYIRNWSVWLDTYVLIRTALSVLEGE